MGTMYTRGLIVFFFFSDFDAMCIPISWAYLFPLRPGGMMGFHRAEFHEALLNRLPSFCHTLPSKRLESYFQRPGDSIMLRFQDGSTATCDMLLGADGIKSAVRKTKLHEAASWATFQHRNADAAELRNLSEPRFSGVFVYRALIPSERLSSVSPQHRASSSAVQVCFSLLGVFNYCIYHIQYLGKNKVSLITQR